MKNKEVEESRIEWMPKKERDDEGREEEKWRIDSIKGDQMKKGDEEK